MSKIEYIETDRDSGFPLRITRRKAVRLSGGGVKSPRLLIKCGCCSEKLEIYYDSIPPKDFNKDGLEINGVNGTVHQWRKVFLPFFNKNISKK